jgi:carbon monoxide dehydrogenase subunit G
MASVERTITVQQPVAKVWEYLADWTNTEEWDPPTVSTERRSGDGGVGTTYTNVSKLLGHETETEYVVTQHDVGKVFQLEGDAGSVKVCDTITFEGSSGADGSEQTTVTYQSEFQPVGAAKLAAPLLPPALKILGDRVAARLQECLDTLGPDETAPGAERGARGVPRDVEVYFQQGEWRIGVPTDVDPISTHTTQEEAADAGRAEAQQRGVELIIRDENGNVTKRESA